MAITPQPVLLAGTWRASDAAGQFQVENPAERVTLPEVYPISSWRDCDVALDAAREAAEVLRHTPAETIGRFLDRFAQRAESRAQEIVERAHLETGYPRSPRLADVEMPRTLGQLRQAAAAAREGSWALPTIDTRADIRSCLAPLGPVCVFGPNNFPLAFGSASGGDFAAAIAAGNPVIAKANTAHPGTTRLFAEEAHAAATELDLPAGTVQLLYRTSHADGQRLVADARLGATGYTGSRSAGLKLKAAADAAGKPIYLELSSTNPVVVLPGALGERAADIANQFTTSCLMGSGQFCTNPGLVMLLAGSATESFINELVAKFKAAPVGTLLARTVESKLAASVATLEAAGAKLLVGGTPHAGPGYAFANTLLRVSGAQFLAAPEVLQTEAFGNASLLVVARDLKEAIEVIEQLDGNLTGSIYCDTHGSDDDAYEHVAKKLRPRVGRLLNDVMPTGVAVSPAMNHGGPYPSTGHPGFTAVGIPASLRRFAMLQCYDHVRGARLPMLLRDKNPTGATWRLIDGLWTQADAKPAS